MRRGSIAIAPIIAIAISCLCMNSWAHSMSPATFADKLLAQDREFAERAAAGRSADDLFAQFADEVIMPVPGKGFAKGKQAAMEAFRAQPDFESSRIEWTPFGAGVSV
ncbi:hypothetical protein, partial [Dokdonella sp.]|uniref:hypothetical protein n=1 Tax=Dokdonella sp. TaxID=2291710 RepID=UPI00352980C3